MKLSSAAVTVAAISLLSATHAAPLGFQDGGIIGRPNHRRGSDLSDLSDASDASAFRANEALDDLNVGFEPASNLILPRILNFIKRQVSSADTATVTSSKPEAGQSTDTGSTSGTTDTDLHTTLMSPNLEDYGFASEGGDSALAPVREVKE